MSKRKRSSRKSAEVLSLGLSPNTRNKPPVEKEESAIQSNPESNKTSLFIYLKTHWWLVGIIAFLALGAIGAGLKYLEEDAQRQIASGKLKSAKEPTLISKINPFLPTPTPTPTPQLSKSYIYAGQRLLVVEDANANAAPPADLAVWRPSSGQWWIMAGTGTQQVTQSWGASGDVPVPGDYDGDGKTDFAVFRPSNSNWYLIYSSTGNTNQFGFGTTGDNAVPADYDGDGKTDVAVNKQIESNHRAILV